MAVLPDTPTVATMPVSKLRASPPDTPRSAAATRDIFTDFRWLDWFCVVLLYILLIYLILQVGLQIFRPGEFDFDFMPLVNGAPCIWILWGGVKLDRRNRHLFRQLDQAGGVAFASVKERNAALSALLGLGARYGLIAAAVTAVSVLGGIASFVGLLSGGHVDWPNASFVATEGRTISFFEAGVMTAICVPVGSYSGWLIGKLLANGRLLDVLRDLGHDLSGFASDSAAATLAAIESIYAYAARATLVLSGILATWWIAFGFGLGAVSNYTMWRFPFTWLWAIAFFAFVFATYRPILAFRRRLDAIYGGEAARWQADAQLTLARSDETVLRRAVEATVGRTEKRRLGRQLADLGQFMESLEARTLRRPILNRSFLTAWLVFNCVAFALPLAWSAAFRPGVGKDDPEQHQQQTGPRRSEPVGRSERGGSKKA